MLRRFASGAMVVGFTVLLATGIATAQDDQDAPRLSSGWAEVLDGGHQMAGNAEQGFVVIGFTDFESSMTEAFYSADGASWERIEIDTPTGDPWGVTDVAVGPAGFIAVSGMPGEDDVDERFVAFSADGRNWERITSDAIPDNNFGHTVIPGSGGYLVEAVNPGSCPSTDAVWFSADGRTWSESQAPLSGCGVAAIAATESGWHLIAGGDTVRVATSEDGENWSVVEAQQPPPSEPFVVEVSLAVSGDTWMLMTSTLDIPGPTPGLWVSLDGGDTWAEPTIQIRGDSPQGDYQPRSWTVTDAGIYGVGIIEDLTDNDQGFLLFSTDGMNWDQFILEGCCNDFAETQSGLVGAGTGTVYARSSQLAFTGPAHTQTFLAVGMALLATGVTAGLARRALDKRATT